MIPKGRHSIDSQQAQSIDHHMPAEEGGNKHDVTNVIILPRVARDWFVQNEARLYQPGTHHLKQKGLNHSELKRIRSPQLGSEHQHQQQHHQDEQRVNLQLHPRRVLDMRRQQQQEHVKGQHQDAFL